MKKIIFTFVIFISLIAFSSFSWASNSTNLTSIVPSNNDISPYLQLLYDDYSSYINSNNIDLNNFYLLAYRTSQYLEVMFSSEPLVRVDSSSMFYTKGFCLYAEFEQGNNIVTVTTFSYDNNAITYDYGAVNIQNALQIYVNKDYILNNVNSSYEVQSTFAEYLFEDYPCNYVIYGSNNDVIVDSSTNNGGDSGGDSGDDSSGILGFLTDFFSNLYDFVIHLVIPTDEQIEYVFDDLGNTLLTPLGLNMNAWHFNNSLTYSQNEQGGYVGQSNLQERYSFPFYFFKYSR